MTLAFFARGGKLLVLSKTDLSACSPEVAILPSTKHACCYPCVRGCLINLPRKKTRTIDQFSPAEALAPSSATNRHPEKGPIGSPNEPKSGFSAANQAAEQQRAEDAPDSRALIGYPARANQGVRLSFMGTGRACCKGEGGRKKKHNWEEDVGKGRERDRQRDTNRQTDRATAAAASGRPENVIPTLIGAVTPKNKSIEQKSSH